MDWLFGAKAKQVTLILQPDESGKKLAGFQGGKPLPLNVTSGETVQAVMDRFNTYRGPENQIRMLWLGDGRPLVFSHVLTENTTAIVRA